MQLNVVFTDEADDTFNSIGSQILDRWGQSELFKFRARVYEIVEKISKSPLIFQQVKKSTNVRKAVIHKNCSLFYTVKGGRIEILFFWDNRQEPIL